jgi:hypothetical protein
VGNTVIKRTRGSLTLFNSVGSPDPRRTFKCWPKALISIPAAARGPDRGASEWVGIFIPLNNTT